ncbi:MAG: hypothetical protein ACKO9Z_09430 [Planctomycetota bacterium]
MLAMIFATCQVLCLQANPDAAKPRFPGPVEGGYLLPNGWTVTPVGRQVELSDLPLNIIADGGRAFVATSGFNRHALSIVDLASAKMTDETTVRQSWYGLARDGATGRIWWAGGGHGQLHSFSIKDGKLNQTSAKEGIGITEGIRLPTIDPTAGFRSGILLEKGAKTLVSLDINKGLALRVDAETGKTIRTSAIGGRPYDVIPSPNGKILMVSDWAGKRVLLLDPETLAQAGSIAVGDHPNQMVAHPKDNRVFVACASSNKVSVIDALRGIVVEEIHTALFPKAPEGSTPCALALDPAGKTLFVACADNNAVAVIDIEPREDGKPASAVKGFIPTGWYPTALAVTPDGQQLLVGVGKGNQSNPNPRYTEEQKKAAEKDEVRSAARRLMPYPYIGTTLSGSLSIIEMPDDAKLKEYTARVYRNCPYSDSQLTTAPSARKTAIPTRVGDKSPIEHVIYIIKENRTYDQVFSDIERGNRDPSLLMFGRKITPNHHKLAEEFVLLDNLYCNGQVSRDGHPWSTGAYHTDYIARDWHLTYSRRKGVDDDDDGDLSNPPSGYLWDACKRAALSYRSYGEYGKRVSEPDGSSRMEGRVPGLIGHFSPKFGLLPKGAGKRAVRDTDKVETFLEEFREYEKNGDLPRFIIMSLGEDHTSGTAPGAFTPEACVASNDLALGRLVEAVSKSKYWAKTAIFVVEDDAQNGPDHVDAHRTIGLVVSPYARRKHLDSTQYATVSMIRTMELILGLPPLSQYDAAARPMFESFTDQADTAPYGHLPAEIDLEAKNKATAYGAARSAKMDFSEYDRIDDFELNEILWRHIKGANAPLPPAVRRAIAFRSQAVR